MQNILTQESEAILFQNFLCSSCIQFFFAETGAAIMRHCDVILRAVYKVFRSPMNMIFLFLFF